MKPTESIFWSVALPGFAQILNGKYLKGFIFIFLEILFNFMANFNEVIMYSFYGEIDKAIQIANYQWLMFYPCLYFFVMWDAYRDAGGRQTAGAFLPFVFSAYFVTLGCIYSARLKLFGYLFGPVWLPILFIIPGLLIGNLLKYLYLKFSNQK